MWKYRQDPTDWQKRYSSQSSCLYTFFIVVVLGQPSDIHLLYEQPVEGAAHPLPPPLNLQLCAAPLECGWAHLPTLMWHYQQIPSTCWEVDHCKEYTHSMHLVWNQYVDRDNYTKTYQIRVLPITDASGCGRLDVLWGTVSGQMRPCWQFLESFPAKVDSRKTLQVASKENTWLLATFTFWSHRSICKFHICSMIHFNIWTDDQLAWVNESGSHCDWM